MHLAAPEPVVIEVVEVVETGVRELGVERPQLADPDDEIVLEAAVNGRSKVIVTHNVRDFEPAAGEFGIEVVTPGTFLKRITP